ncbi:hypothetical protein RRG08_059581 [Elysia crispata]|uniref:Uncharacterized protein n=1 Tax=Elysia crispata TaxID=231223 RepID=A0AAE1DWW1_9GAST|nr:hypothetical protein RRG08_059581 [Elysia crispata]
MGGQALDGSKNFENYGGQGLDGSKTFENYGGQALDCSKNLETMGSGSQGYSHSKTDISRVRATVIQRLTSPESGPKIAGKGLADWQG